jgi:hypothetical protein
MSPHEMELIDRLGKMYLWSFSETDRKRLSYETAMVGRNLEIKRPSHRGILIGY